MATLEAHEACAATPGNCIRIRGARVHNLKNVDLDIPRDELVVITGPSGSGKSSLAFDTLFAEGQRQYIESLSTYARQFLHQLQRPDVDEIEGLQPTVCIDQRPSAPNPRSTVATITEVYDYLRLLLARCGEVFCYKCGAPIRRQSPSQIEERLLSMPEGTRLMLLAPIVRGRKGQHDEALRSIQKAGFVRARVDGQVYELDQIPELAPRRNHDLEAVVDRIVIRQGVESRLGESIQLALDHGEGVLIACTQQNLTDGSRSEWRDEIFSTLHACPHCQISYGEIEPRTFSFNSPYGACSECDGLGRRVSFDLEQIIPSPEKTLAEGAIAAAKGMGKKAKTQFEKNLDRFVKAHKIDAQRPLALWTESQREKLLYGDGKAFPGVLNLLDHDFATSTSRRRLAQLESMRSASPCRACQGARLRPEALQVRLAGKSVQEIVQLPVLRAIEFFREYQSPQALREIAAPLVAEILHRLEFMEKVGVGYLSLGRAGDTLSGGERQRVRLATSIGTGLVGTCFVLDEPSIGLHPRDNDRLIASLLELRDQGNSVIVVEHDEAIMRAADWLIDFGPGAGSGGGEVVAAGTVADVMRSADSITAVHLRGEAHRGGVPSRRKVLRSKMITLGGACLNNLKRIDVEFPLGVLLCVTGVSGSGKSSLVNDTLARAAARKTGLKTDDPGSHESIRGLNQIDKLVQIDQSAIGRSPRSNAATYTGVFDEIRKVFANSRDAKQFGFDASRFSFNVKGGRCEACQGQGVQKIEMNFLPDLFVPCDACEGKRFNDQTLAVKYRGASIADCLAMSVSEARHFFEHFTNIARLLESMERVGLGYLPLGQPSTTMSGGESQRVKLATELARVDTGDTLYILDEPTTGLHFDDVRRLIEVLGDLVDKGNSVIVIEHHPDMMRAADWIIDLGPEGGDEGGEVIAVGTPEEVAQGDTHTGRYLRAAV